MIKRFDQTPFSILNMIDVPYVHACIKRCIEQLEEQASMHWPARR
jgi:hypothetical protein